MAVRSMAVSDCILAMRIELGKQALHERRLGFGVRLSIQAKLLRKAHLQVGVFCRERRVPA